MSKTKAITQVSVHWMPPMASCHLSMHRGDVCEEGVALRPNVALDQRAPEGWQHELTAFEHGAKLSPEDAAALLRSLGSPEWEEDVHETLSTVELRGRTDSLKFWLTCHSPSGVKKSTPEQLEETKGRLLELRTAIWG